MAKIMPDWFSREKDPQLREQIIELLSNQLLRSTFLKILDRIEAEEERMEITLSAYDSPSWAYKQADLNGARRAYSKMRALFNTKDSKTNG